MANPTSTYLPIRPLDLSDPQLVVLNQRLQTLQQQISAVSGAVNPTSSQGANTWTDWIPNITTGMTWALAQIFEAKYLQLANQVFVNLDIQGTLSGTLTNSIRFSLPSNLLPASNFANLMPALAFNAAATPAYARTQNNGLAVTLNAGTFATGVCEILVSGWYRIGG